MEKHFRPEAKARMQVLVENLRQAFDSGIDGLDWMSPTTKVEAKKKLAKFVTKIGYPDRWRDYGKLTIEPGDLVGNVDAGARSSRPSATWPSWAARSTAASGS